MNKEEEGICKDAALNHCPICGVLMCHHSVKGVIEHCAKLARVKERMSPGYVPTVTLDDAIKSELGYWSGRKELCIILSFLACVRDRMNGGDARFEQGTNAKKV